MRQSKYIEKTVICKDCETRTTIKISRESKRTSWIERCPRCGRMIEVNLTKVERI